MLCAFILSDGHGDVVDGQTPFLEQVFAHVGEGGRRVDGVASDAVLLKVRRRVPTLFTSDMTKQGMLNSVFLSLSLSLSLSSRGCCVQCTVGRCSERCWLVTCPVHAQTI